MLSNVNSAMVSLIFLSAIYATAGCLLSDLAISWLYSHYPDELSSPHTLGKSTILRNVLLWLGGLICAYSTMVPSICHSLLPDAILSEILRLLSCSILLICCATDWEQRMLFDYALAPLAIIGITSCLLSGQSITDHILAAAAGGGFFLILGIITRGGFGGGDIKLIAALGLLLGTEKLLAAVFCGILAGGAAALIMLIVHKKDRKSYIAYGPYFAIIAILLLTAKV